MRGRVTRLHPALLTHVQKKAKPGETPSDTLLRLLKLPPATRERGLKATKTKRTKPYVRPDVPYDIRDGGAYA